MSREGGLAALNWNPCSGEAKTTTRSDVSTVQKHKAYARPKHPSRTSKASRLSMAQSLAGSFSQNDLFSFPDFIQTQFRDSNIVHPNAFPVNDNDRISIANVVEDIDRISVQGILVQAVTSHLHEDFGKHASMVCKKYWDTRSRNIYECWLEAAADGQRDRLLDEIRSSLERVPLESTRDLLLEGVLAYSDIAQACLDAVNAMSTELSTALSVIEVAFQSCHKMLAETRHLVECQCSAAYANDEFLESCCEVAKQISTRREQLHITFSTIGGVVEQTPAWETRRDALRTLNKLYWKCKNCNTFVLDGEWGTDVVKKHLIDLMGGVAEGMGPSERQRYMDEGFSFNVLDSLEGKVYEALKDLKRAADNIKANKKDSTATTNAQKTNPRSETTNMGEKYMSDNAGIRKTETKRLKRRRAKDRKALQKALASLGLGDIEEHAA